jgi:hypothetical protein
MKTKAEIEWQLQRLVEHAGLQVRQQVDRDLGQRVWRHIQIPLERAHWQIAEHLCCQGELTVEDR